MAERIIKKYQNRRLYDTEASRYVTMAEIRELIVAGVDVTIVEESSGNDITRSVLVQILSDQEQGGQPVLSDKTLMQIIRYYGHPMQGFMTNYIEQGVEAFAAQQDQVMEHMNASLKNTPFGAMQQQLQDAAMTGMKSWTEAQETLLKAMAPGATGTKDKTDKE